jgi:hypothetical protein
MKSSYIRNIIALLKSDEIPSSFSEEFVSQGYDIACLQTLEFDFEKYAEEFRDVIIRETNITGGIIFPSKRAVEALEHTWTRLDENVKEFYLNVCYR